MTGGLFLCGQAVRRNVCSGLGTVCGPHLFYRAEQSGGHVRSIAMAEERDDEQTNETEGTSSQQPAGQQN